MGHKFLNDPGSAVTEMLEGFVQSHPGVKLLDGFPDVKVVVRSHVDKNKVALVSGGGSGHEPAHAGFVGDGMLDAAVCGDVFASPSVAAVLAAIRHVTGPPGCLLIVKNYTGDRLNFGLAAERAKLEGLNVEMVVVADDCALPPPLGVAGRRGLAGTLFVHKCAGAAAAAGDALDLVAEEARAAASAVGTMGVASAAHKLPGADDPARAIPPGELEMGLGIHGEPGAFTAPAAPVASVVAKMLETIEKTKVCVMVNSLGSTPAMELHVAARCAREWLSSHDLNPVRVYTGSFMTALDMTGFSITLCQVDSARLARIDAPTGAPAWPVVARTVSVPVPPPKTECGALAKKAILGAAEMLKMAEDELTDADAKVGDGDCGTTHARGARALEEDVVYMPLDEPSELALAIGMTVRRSMGGTSGALYDIFFSAAAAAMKGAPATSPATWLAGFKAGIASMSRYGGASEGDRTVLDALLPAAEAASKAITQSAGGAWAASVAADAAEKGAAATKEMVASAGRSSYVPVEVMKSVPDPGATAAAAWIRGVAIAIA
ncbi:predicted protein [Micromonas commoda]|uniref:Dihydroxyacetone kinase n=1 Tax=Micromonas commoda (strain RCC299 / NOUM17 / CCMP2709) TaxID=296587 RepID=C1FJL5_MICCC|nr:predicted protein [Micromonas commoda]ACO70619.1 predicted protein [Micromonas commoda]|eukprot:XP_002509361.1 predicted protein [Micromonas commoda]